MKYTLSFHSLDQGPGPELTFYGQSMPLVPRVGERVDSEMFDRAGHSFVKDVSYKYGEDSISVVIIVGTERL